MNRKQLLLAALALAVSIFGLLLLIHLARQSASSSVIPHNPVEGPGTSEATVPAALSQQSHPSNNPAQTQMDPSLDQAKLPSNEREEAEQRKARIIDEIVGALNTPIIFYGKVVDQFGSTIADAEVNFGAADKFNAPGTNYKGISDTNGLFSISGIKGITLSVGVGKVGYYDVHGKSAMTFAYGTGTDKLRKEPPTKENPAVFLLWKMGDTEPLVEWSNRRFEVAKDGQATQVDLASAKLSSAGLQLLQVESWIGDTDQNEFDWRFRLSVPGGGLIERTGQFDFEAPQEGYKPSIEVYMLGSAENWKSRGEAQYFARLPDGTFARFLVRFHPGSHNSIFLDCHLNPIPGHRNLEFDPAKKIKPLRGVSPNY